MGEREGVLTGTLQAPGLAPRGTPSGAFRKLSWVRFIPWNASAQLSAD